MPKLILVRGLPGSGKSTYAETLGMTHFEADQFFTDGGGRYSFNPSKLGQAHIECLRKTHYVLCMSQSPRSVVVSNTFTQKWEIQKYLWLAEMLDVEVEIHKCVGNFQNVHGVPPEAIERMKARWEPIEGEITVTCDQNISATL